MVTGLSFSVHGEGEGASGGAPRLGHTRTRALALLLSCLLHGAFLGLAILSIGLSSSQKNEVDLQVIPIELLKWQPKPQVPEPKVAQKNSEEVRNEEVPVSEPDTVKKGTPTEHYSQRSVKPIDQRVPKSDSDSESDFGAFFSAISCPSFIDPADLDLMERCAHRQENRSKEEWGAKKSSAETKIAAVRRQNAIDNGWLIPRIELTEQQKTIERESQVSAPSADVFGPWPWE